MNEINYFDYKRAINIHDDILEISGGLPGVKDPGRLESALEFIQIDLYYPDFLDKLSELIIRIACFHVFNDGNKRTSIGLGALFLEINDFPDDVISHFITEMENIIVLLVDHALSQDDFYKLLGVMISGAPYPEEQQFILYQAYTIYEKNEKERELNNRA
ncbi:type II toxin-antitoxin system death-on-curing family toxin [Enterococcus diestrammenae]|uniref:Fido domain-containing protein n=1 Tax=Enterococcus diestrammenae TaxID=1155073 RepID=A0ABV0EYT0_9ENTE|nr:type II toxin-antitoxin system death-on-curing family toxin [Enterococcus diestrammenae]KAF1294773.1 hypothetical protein BAU18_03465 [Enterococcus diestrammenae]